ncbi:MAG: hypothetical protein PHX93_05885 [Candidatus Peribacteraceae bacterium]|nr:hypothetical protein [Candidatus Peribacteraceae bacterium]
MVVLLPVEAPDGTPVFVNPVESPRTPEQLTQQAEDARNARVIVNNRTGEVRRQCDGLLLPRFTSAAQNTQE